MAGGVPSWEQKAPKPKANSNEWANVKDGIMESVEVKVLSEPQKQSYQWPTVTKQ